MESIYRFSEPEILAFAMMLIRVSTFVVAWPIFGVESVPASVKILFALMVTFLIFPAVEWQNLTASFGSSQLIWLSVKEAFIGVMFGFLARMFLMATRVAGELVSLALGLSGAQLYNPAMGGMSSPLDQFFFALAGLVFLSINGHHLFLMGLVDTFRIIPMGPELLSMSPLLSIGEIVQDIVIIGIKISAPVMMSILVVNMVMGILGKTVPQINVLITSLAVNVLVGLVVLILALPLMVGEVPDLLETSANRLFQIVKAM
ncbi:MAG: flagellar biosynthetic protein FliR [Bdellovibrionales bacterium]